MSKRNRRARLVVSLAILTVLAPVGVVAGDYSYRYDALGRLEAVLTPNGSVTRYFYDDAGNRKQVITYSGTTGDMGGDGRADVIWQKSDGNVATWTTNMLGGFQPNTSATFPSVSSAWKAVGVGDINGDGKADIVWRNETTLQLTDWLGQGNGSFTGNDANALTSVPADWSVVGVGDFNGDGRADLLWRSTTGGFSNWLGKANGGFTINDSNAAASVSVDWQVFAVADFNGDGRADVLWRNINSGDFSDWLGTPAGGFVGNDGNAYTTGRSLDWKIIGAADFNNDGRADILWRHATSGTFSYWRSKENGGFFNSETGSHTIPNDWRIVGTGDYNGDGRADLLWRNGASVSNWLATYDGDFAANDANASTTTADALWKALYTTSPNQ